MFMARGVGWKGGSWMYFFFSRMVVDKEPGGDSDPTTCLLHSALSPQPKNKKKRIEKAQNLLLRTINTTGDGGSAAMKYPSRFWRPIHTTICQTKVDITSDE